VAGADGFLLRRLADLRGFLAAALVNLGIGVMAVLGPIIAADELGGAAAWGVILTGGAIGGLLGGVLPCV
jgi:hypothetical protein